MSRASSRPDRTSSSRPVSRRARASTVCRLSASRRRWSRPRAPRRRTRGRSPRSATARPAAVRPPRARCCRCRTRLRPGARRRAVRTRCPASRPPAGAPASYGPSSFPRRCACERLVHLLETLGLDHRHGVTRGAEVHRTFTVSSGKCRRHVPGLPLVDYPRGRTRYTSRDACRPAAIRRLRGARSVAHDREREPGRARRDHGRVAARLRQREPVAHQRSHLREAHAHRAAAGADDRRRPRRLRRADHDDAAFGHAHRAGHRGVARGARRAGGAGAGSRGARAGRRLRGRVFGAGREGEHARRSRAHRIDPGGAGHHGARLLVGERRQHARRHQHRRRAGDGARGQGGRRGDGGRAAASAARGW